LSERVGGISRRYRSLSWAESNSRWLFAYARFARFFPFDSKAIIVNKKAPRDCLNTFS